MVVFVDLHQSLSSIKMIMRWSQRNKANGGGLILKELTQTSQQESSSMVKNNIREPGPIVFSPINRGEAIRKALGMTPTEVIELMVLMRLSSSRPFIMNSRSPAPVSPVITISASMMNSPATRYTANSKNTGSALPPFTNFTECNNCAF